jgi:hypothetical protein
MLFMVDAKARAVAGAPLRDVAGSGGKGSTVSLFVAEGTAAVVDNDRVAFRPWRRTGELGDT